MSPEKRFWLWVLAVALGLFALVGAQAVLFFHQQAVLLGRLSPEMQARLAVFLAVAVLTVAVLFAFVLRALFRRHVFPLRPLAEDVEALLHGLPGARIETADSGELGRLSRDLNALMQRHQSAEERFEERLQQAVREAMEQEHLAGSILDALREGVIVCGTDCRVRRYNQAAQRLLGSGPELGAGRELPPAFARPLMEYALERLHDQLAQGVQHPTARFLSDAAGRTLRVRVAPLLESLGRMEGLVVTLDDVTEEPGEPQEAPVPEALAPPPPRWEERLHEPLQQLRCVVFDTETTGLDPTSGDEIIAIGAVAVVEGRVREDEVFEHLINPQRSLSAASIRVHGIRPEMLAGRPTAGRVLPLFARFVHDAVLVAHNAAFDMRFLRLKQEAAGVRFDQPVLDTMLLSAVLHPNQPSHALDALVRRYGIPVRDRHDALGDALMTAQLFVRLLPQLQARGIVSLQQALDASRASPLARLAY